MSSPRLFLVVFTQLFTGASVHGGAPPVEACSPSCSSSPRVRSGLVVSEGFVERLDGDLVVGLRVHSDTHTAPDATPATVERSRLSDTRGARSSLDGVLLRPGDEVRLAVVVPVDTEIDSVLAALSLA